MNIRTLCFAALAATVALAGCTKDKAAEEINKKSMAQIYSEEGTPVNVATVKTSSFQTALSYDAAVKGIYESTASAKLSDSVESVKYSVGDWVDKDAVVVTFPKNNPSANYYQAKTIYENLEATYKRMSTLYKAKGISKQDYDNAVTAYENAKATWDNVNEMVNVKAPISGLITRLDVQKTDNVKAGDVLFAVTDDSKLKGKVWIQERDISKVSKGMKVTATWNGAEITGRISQLDLALNPDMQAFGALIELDNAEGKIPSGVNAKINIVAYENNNVIALDRKNITFDGKRAYVFIASGNKAVKKEVKTGSNFGNKVEIISGIKAGDKLITDGNKNIADGTFIRVIDQE
ncbi:MAG: efflux RND transporter periplasmic adaptor subunit [Spirochaetia bacterium]|nr:efflux RND transporter periplasmic adaptor subunit [Spirochaetia bacterium]